MKKDNAIAYYKKILEADVIKEIGELIAVYQLSIFRQNTGATKIGKRFVRFGEPGTGDYAGWCKHTGRHVEIECKRPNGGVLSSVQRRRLDAINKAGGVGIVATSAADCYAQLKEAEVIR